MSPTYWVVGLGRVGSLLARLALENEALAGVTIRPDDDVARAEALTEGRPVTTEVPATLPADCVVLLCVPDSLLLPVASSWSGTNAVAFVHFSGALGVVAMAQRVGAVDVAALHPLLSVSSPDMDVQEARGVTFGLSGDGIARTAALQLAGWMGGDVVDVHEDARAAWHLAATIASNGVYALLSVATQVAAAGGITGFDVERGLASLAAQSAKSAATHGSVAGATGPVVRGDASTVHKHLQVLQHDVDARSLYVAMTRALLDIAEIRGVGDTQLAAIRSLVEAAGQGD